MSQVSGEDIERLASRMAMLVSDDGEADNAGRAVGQLARRLGLSGGDLKQIVLTGAGTGFQPGGQASLARLQQEVGTLRRALAQAEEAARAARQERDTLVAENGAMRVAIYRHRATRRLQRMMLTLGLIGVGVVGVAMLFFGPNLFDPLPRPDLVAGMGRPAAETGRNWVVGRNGAFYYRTRDLSSPPVGRLEAGAKVRVLGEPQPGIVTWVPVEVHGIGYFVPYGEIEPR